MSTHLIIPDPHVKMGVSNDRFIWAGKFARELKPDVIICLGDWVNMDSLSHFDRGKKAFEGRRYNKEIDHADEALDIPFEYYGWEYHDYEIPVEIDGILYCHHFASGVLGKPISGENIASGLLKKNYQSTTAGHSHLFDYAVRSMINGKKLMGLNAGCYLNHKESFAKATQHLWTSGLVVKRNVNKGEYDLQTINIKELKKRYG